MCSGEIRCRERAGSCHGSNRVSLDGSPLALACEAHLKAHGHPGGVAFDATNDRLVVPIENGVFQFVKLGGLRAELDDAPEWERARVLDRWLWSLFPTGAVAQEQVLARVLPRLRDHVYFAVLDRQGRAQIENPDERKGAEVPFQVVNDTLCINLVFETPTSMSDVTRERLESWKLTFEQVLERAKQNLKARSTLPLQKLETGLYTSPYEDGHDPARLLLPGALDGLQLTGAPVVMVPSQGAMLVAGEGDARALVRMGELSKALLQDARGLSGVCYRVENGVYVPWLPAKDHPAHETLFVLALQTLGNAYAHQKDLLEAWHEVSGEQLFVARYAAYRGDDGVIFTVTHWQDGVTTLLPKADRVELVRLLNADEAQVWRVDWSVLESTVGELLTALPEHPVRYRTKGFPTDAQLNDMANRSKQSS